jgi:hypothetical protein
MRASPTTVDCDRETPLAHGIACLLFVALSGCATVVVPTQIQFSSLKPGADAVQMFDARPAQAREYREDGRAGTFKFLGDDALRPSAVDLIASRLFEALPASHRGRPVELRRLDVGFLVSPSSLPTSTGTTISVSSDTPGGAIVAGLVLAYGMIATLTRARADERGVAYIEVWVGSDQLRAAQTVPIVSGVGAVQAVESALAAALDDLANQARELKTTTEHM